MVNAPVLIDGHVHFYEVFDERTFWHSAAENFHDAARGLDQNPAVAGVLLFTETSHDDYYGRLGRAAPGPLIEGWSVAPTADPEAVLVSGPGDCRILAVAGRQIVTAEGLEVSAIATTGRLRDGLPLGPTVELALAAGAVVALPWGLGKWTLGRGRALARFLDAVHDPPALLSDNGGRPAWLPEPRAIRRARAEGRPVLAGSDPLPLKGGERQVGRYGFILHGALDLRAPARALRDLLGNGIAQPRFFGCRERTSRFLANQTRMQLRKYL